MMPIMMPFIIEAQLEDGQIYETTSWGRLEVLHVLGRSDPVIKIKLMRPKIIKINRDHDIHEVLEERSEETVNGLEPRD